LRCHFKIVTKPLRTVEQPKLLAEGRRVMAKENPPAKPERRDVVSIYIEEIHHRAETISPLLQELLEFRPPPHWGINE
jgi:hypothetical protein